MLSYYILGLMNVTGEITAKGIMAAMTDSSKVAHLLGGKPQVSIYPEARHDSDFG